MPTADFSDAEIKLARARDHVLECEQIIGRLTDPSMYKIDIQMDGWGGIVEYESLHQPDKQINSVIGDCIGNLRSVLDYVAVALIYPITGNYKNVGFPFADDAHGFKGEVNNASFSAASSEVRDFLINEVQAYKGGKGESLWAVNKLRNIDKHRFLITTINLAGIIASFKAGPNTATNFSSRIPAGKKQFFLGAFGTGPVEFTDGPRPTFEVRIQEPPIVDGTPVGGFLHRLCGDTERFLNAFKSAMPPLP